MTRRRSPLLYGGVLALVLGGLALAGYWRTDPAPPPAVAPDDYRMAGDTAATVAGLPLPPLDGELY